MLDLEGEMIKVMLNTSDYPEGLRRFGLKKDVVVIVGIY